MSVSLSSEVSEDTQNWPKNQTAGWNIPSSWVGVTGGISETSDGTLAWGRSSLESIAANRVNWISCLQITADSCITLEQTHSSRIERVGQRHCGSGFMNPASRIPDTDGMITQDAFVTLVTSHADCAPIYLFHSESRSIGLIHAGWRGTLAGIASTGILKMQEEFGVVLSELQVAVGPMITTRNYPVGDDVAAQFVKKFGPGVVTPYADRQHLDIFAAIIIDLLRAGVVQARFCSRPPDTFADNRWSSYRRDGERAGGMLAYLRLT